LITNGDDSEINSKVKKSLEICCRAWEAEQEIDIMGLSCEDASQSFFSQYLQNSAYVVHSSIDFSSSKRQTH